MGVAEVVNNLFPLLSQLVRDVLRGVLPTWLADIIASIVNISVFLGFATVTVMLVVYLERRVIALMQDRLGPNRVGPQGLLQSPADVLKLLTKEDIIPVNADPWIFRLAPIVLVVTALLIYSVIPFGEGMIIADLHIGILFFVAVSSAGAVGILMAGWGSNNKFALIGAMRAVAQLISYEIPLVFSIIGVALLSGSLSTVDIVRAQANSVWFILLQPVGFLVFFVASTAELNRTPFDLMEAESEIVAGYHVEYSGMRFALFYLAEYLNAFAAAALGVTLFFGGWLGPVLPPYVWFLIKTYAVFFVLFWLRGTLPRVRIDQLMALAWKVLLPLSLANMAITGVGAYLARTSAIGTPVLTALAIAFWAALIGAFVLWVQRRSAQTAPTAELARR